MSFSSSLYDLLSLPLICSIAPSLDMLQNLSVLPELRGPELDTRHRILNATSPILSTEGQLLPSSCWPYSFWYRPGCHSLFSHNPFSFHFLHRSFQLMISPASSRLETLPANRELVATVLEATSLIPKVHDNSQSIPKGPFLVNSSCWIQNYFFHVPLISPLLIREPTNHQFN